MGTAAGFPRAIAREARRRRSLTAGIPATIERSNLGSTYSRSPRPSVSMTSFLTSRARSRVRRSPLASVPSRSWPICTRVMPAVISARRADGRSDFAAYHSGERTASR